MEQQSREETKIGKKPAFLRALEMLLWNCSHVGRSATVQQNATDEGHAGSKQPLSAPDLNRLPVGKGACRIHEAGDDRGSYAHESCDKADHRADSETELAAEMVKLQDAPAAFGCRGSAVASHAAHAAIWRIHDEFRATVPAEIVANRGIGNSRPSIGSSRAVAGCRCFLPVLVIKHGLPVTAFSSKRIRAHGKIPNPGNRHVKRQTFLVRKLGAFNGLDSELLRPKVIRG